MQVLKRLARELLRRAGLAKVPFSATRECPICGYKGHFYAYGVYYIRPDAICARCGSAERHRLLKLVLDQHLKLEGKPAVLHFAPEAAVTQFLKPIAGTYTTADLMAPGVDHHWNIEKIDCPDQQFDVVVCSHVLEHVDDHKALLEFRRILRPGGLAILMIPICEGLDQSYENPRMKTEQERWLHFQQWDHVRIFGRDFRDRVRNAGFDLTEFVAEGEQSVKYGLVMGERVFVARV